MSAFPRRLNAPTLGHLRCAAMCGSDGAPPLSAALPLSLALDSTEAFLLPAVRVFELRTLRFSRPSSRDCRNRSTGTEFTCELIPHASLFHLVVVTILPYPPRVPGGTSCLQAACRSQASTTRTSVEGVATGDLVLVSFHSKSCRHLHSEAARDARGTASRPPHVRTFRLHVRLLYVARE